MYELRVYLVDQFIISLVLAGEFIIMNKTYWNMKAVWKMLSIEKSSVFQLLLKPRQQNLKTYTFNYLIDFIWLSIHLRLDELYVLNNQQNLFLKIYKNDGWNIWLL